MKNKVFVRFWKRDPLLSEYFIDVFQNLHILGVITSTLKFLSAHHVSPIVCISASSTFKNHLKTWPIDLIFRDLTVSKFISFVFSKTKSLRGNLVQICWILSIKNLNNVVSFSSLPFSKLLEFISAEKKYSLWWISK